MFKTTSAAPAPTQESCAALLRHFKPDEDIWTYSEFMGNQPGGFPLHQLRSASHPELATSFQECADHHLLFGSEAEAGSNFFFRPARSKKSAQGRLFRLNVPEVHAGKLSGSLAIQLKTSRSGEILDKKILFTTNTALGDLVLASIDKWITVKAPGSDAGPFDDDLHLRFEDGALAMASESHWFTPAKAGPIT